MVPKFTDLIVFTILSSHLGGQYNTVKATTFKVKGITCATDVKTIASNIEKLAGVINCKADKPGATTSFELKFNPARVTEKEIVAAIENTGGCENPNDRPYKVKQ